MPCDFPIRAYETPEGLKFKPPREHSGVWIPLPCRKCIGCGIDRKRDWSVRGIHEAQMHHESQFLTLTYDDQNVPDGHNLDFQHLTEFWREIRRDAPEAIRYMAAGEYGGQTSRPHFHAIAFGLAAPDRQVWGRNNRGEMLYTAESIQKYWPHGRVVVADVTYETCGYVAGYMLKDTRTMDKDKSRPYTVIDSKTGIETERVKPKGRYSTRPGIGASWFEKYHGDCFPKGNVHIIKNGKAQTVPVPEYYWRLLERMDPQMYADLKAERQEVAKSDKVFFDNTQKRRNVKAEVREAKMSLKKRGTDQKVEPKTVIV